jgi:hypothetical protein
MLGGGSGGRDHTTTRRADRRCSIPGEDAAATTVRDLRAVVTAELPDERPVLLGRRVLFRDVPP